METMLHCRPSTENLTFEYQNLEEYKRQSVYCWYIKGNKSIEFMNFMV